MERPGLWWWSFVYYGLMVELMEEVAGLGSGVAGYFCEGWRSVVEQFGGEDGEGGGVVDVVQEGEFDEFDVSCFGAVLQVMLVKGSGWGYLRPMR